MLELLTRSVNQLKGVGTKRAQLYEKLGVRSVYSLLHLFPRNYIDITKSQPIISSIFGDTCTIRATVYQKLPEQRIRKGLTLYKAYVTDGVANLMVTIFNNKYAYMALELDKEYLFYGKISGNSLRREMSNPQIFSSDQGLTMQPVYPLTEGLTNKMVVTNQKEALRLFSNAALELLPKSILEEYQLSSFSYAMQQIHFPQDEYTLSLARKRLVFEELLVWQIGLAQLKHHNQMRTCIQLKSSDWSALEKQLPFELTGAQKRVISECATDAMRDIPMNRLVQGDVGSGKTMVAGVLCYLMAKSGYQSAMMAPTEILASQHYETLSRLLNPMGISVCLLTGSMTRKQKEICKEEILTGVYQVVVGTHTLVQESTVFSSLGLVITDEQHRFGVGQRQRLVEKGDNPHVLVMSATPIPRTLALILYGDLDISIIDELPKGRQVIETFAIPPSKRKRAFGFVKQQLDQGRQAYIVCPMIEDGDREAASVNAYAEQLKDTVLSTVSMGILHGKLPADEKEQLMDDFKAGKIQLLISTTVVEVGVDVPNATVMMIENAELFGLSQMHQLRGRVGRGSYQSYCILVTGLNTEENRKRLDTMCRTSDGFQIAEEDLKLRGPGDFFGKRQHGLPEFRIADMVEDMDVLKSTQNLARKLVQEDPNLEKTEHRGLRWMVDRLFQEHDTAV